MSLTGFFLVLFTAGLTMIANLMLRAGIDAAGGFVLGGATEILRALLKLFMQPLFSIGVAVYFLARVVWFRVVATEPLSLAYPLLVSLTFTLVTAGAVVYFSEPLSLRKAAGLAVILAGIAIISLDKSDFVIKSDGVGASFFIASKISSAFEPQLLWIQNFKDAGGLVRPRLNWYPTKNTTVGFGVDIFTGSADGFFGRYNNRDRAYADVRYGF